MPPPGSAPRPSSSSSTPASSTSTATSTSSSSTPRTRPEDILYPPHRCQSRAGGGAALDLLPTLWFRNTWAWGTDARRPKPDANRTVRSASARSAIDHPREPRPLPAQTPFCEAPELALVHRERDELPERLFGRTERPHAYVRRTASTTSSCRASATPSIRRPKLAPRRRLLVFTSTLAPARRRSRSACGCRVATSHRPGTVRRASSIEMCCARSHREADEFYHPLAIRGPAVGRRLRGVMRQAFAGMLWSKQFYGYDVKRWLHGHDADPDAAAARAPERAQPRLDAPGTTTTSSPCRTSGSIPGTPPGTWPSTCHAFAPRSIRSSPRSQLILLLREWYMHPNGQIPAYEWASAT